MEPKEKQGKLDQASKENLRFLRKKAEVFLLSAAFLQKRVCLGFPLMGKLFYKSAFLGLPGREAVSRRLTDEVFSKKVFAFLPSVEKAKKLKEKPRERTAVIFFTDIFGVRRNPSMTPRSFSFRFLFFFQKEKEDL